MVIVRNAECEYLRLLNSQIDRRAATVKEIIMYVIFHLNFNLVPKLADRETFMNPAKFRWSVLHACAILRLRRYLFQIAALKRGINFHSFSAD